MEITEIRKFSYKLNKGKFNKRLIKVIQICTIIENRTLARRVKQIILTQNSKT